MGRSDEAIVADVARTVVGRHVGCVVVATGHSTRLSGPVEPDATTIFEIGSVTKVFTSLALADAVVDGVLDLDLDAPVLATHTSGLPRSTGGLISELRTQDPYSGVSDEDVLSSLPRWWLRSRPGSRMRYSNIGVALLGLGLLRSRMRGPLGLPDTVVRLSGAQHDRLAQGHRWRRRAATSWAPDGMVGRGGGGLLSTAR